MDTVNGLSATLEDYLEVILNIEKEHKVARSMEIADQLGVKRPTVTTALQTLSKKGLINYEPRSYITLTSAGEKIAQCISKRHHVLEDVFTKVLLLSREDAVQTACIMEHGMNSQVCKALTSLLLAVNKDEAFANTLRTTIENESKNINCNSSCNNRFSDVGREKMDHSPMNLNALNSGMSAKIVKIKGSGVLKKRLQELGVTTGQTITAIKAAPLNDPIEVKIRNCNITLRREEAADIVVELL